MAKRLLELCCIVSKCYYYVCLFRGGTCVSIGCILIRYMYRSSRPFIISSTLFSSVTHLICRESSNVHYYTRPIPRHLLELDI